MDNRSLVSTLISDENCWCNQCRRQCDRGILVGLKRYLTTVKTPQIAPCDGTSVVKNRTHSAGCCNGGCCATEWTPDGK